MSVEGQRELACPWRAVLGQEVKELASGKTSRICSHSEAESIVFFSQDWMRSEPEVEGKESGWVWLRCVTCASGITGMWFHTSHGPHMWPYPDVLLTLHSVGSLDAYQELIPCHVQSSTFLLYETQMNIILLEVILFIESLKKWKGSLASNCWKSKTYSSSAFSIPEGLKLQVLSWEYRLLIFQIKGKMLHEAYWKLL